MKLVPAGEVEIQNISRRFLGLGPWGGKGSGKARFSPSTPSGAGTGAAQTAQCPHARARFGPLLARRLRCGIWCRFGTGHSI